MTVYRIKSFDNKFIAQQQAKVKGAYFGQVLFSDVCYDLWAACSKLSPNPDVC